MAMITRVCLDCQQEKRMGKTKKRCKECRNIKNNKEGKPPSLTQDTEEHLRAISRQKL